MSIISRLAAIDAVNERITFAKAINPNVDIAELEKAILNIENLPSAEEIGRWIEYKRVIIPEPYNRWEQAWYCSKCGYGNHDSDERGRLKWRYCPNCGARMIESEGDE